MHFYGTETLISDRKSEHLCSRYLCFSVTYFAISNWHNISVELMFATLDSLHFI